MRDADREAEGKLVSVLLVLVGAVLYGIAVYEVSSSLWRDIILLLDHARMLLEVVFTHTPQRSDATMIGLAVATVEQLGA
jgi:hypothetical protein